MPRRTLSHPWKTALVTGASSGIGEAIARRLTAAGVDVTVVARRAQRLEKLSIELASRYGVTVEALTADLAIPTDLERVAARLADPDRPIDLLVNCAGIGASGPFVDGDAVTYRNVVAVNVDALVGLTHTALGPMLARDRGWVLNVSSLGGHSPGPLFAVYSATKAFVTSFSESLFEEVRGTGVTVTVLCPGATHTEFGASAGATGDDLPGVLWQTADEVALEGLTAVAAGRAVRVSGLPNRLSAAVTTVLPRSANRRLAALVTDRL